MQQTDTEALAAPGKNKQCTSSTAQTAGDEWGVGVSALAANPTSPIHFGGIHPDLEAEHPSVVRSYSAVSIQGHLAPRATAIFTQDTVRSRRTFGLIPRYVPRGCPTGKWHG